MSNSQEEYLNYALAKNLSFLLSKYNITSIDCKSLYALTSLIKHFILTIACRAKHYSELSNRLETNMLDLLSALITSSNLTQTSLISYINTPTPLNTSELPSLNVSLELSLSHQRSEQLLKQLNSANVPFIENALSISTNTLNAIPSNLKYFPRQFALSNSSDHHKQSEQNEKIKKEIKSIEKKSIEDIISSNSYYDMSKKQARQKNYVDIISLYNEIVKEGNNESGNNGDNMFGRRFRMKEAMAMVNPVVLNNDNVNMINMNDNNNVNQLYETQNI